MQIDSISFAGYRPFPDALSGGELQRFVLRPLTLVFGKNSSGKSALVRFAHVVLQGLASDSPRVLPLHRSDRRFAPTFSGYLHKQQTARPMSLELVLSHEAEQEQLKTLLLQAHDLDSEGILCLRRSFGHFAAEEPSIPALGLLPQELELATLWRARARELVEKSVWLGPVRSPIERSYTPEEWAPPRMDPFGVRAPHYLAGSSALMQAAGEWMARSLGAGRLSLSLGPDSFSLQLRGSNLAFAGEGHQQLLAVLVHGLMRAREPESASFLDVIEQPELHLHPAVHGAVADLLIGAMKPAGRLLVETHSEELLLRVRRRVAEGSLDAADVALYFVQADSKGSSLRRIHIDNGDVDFWPAGVFSEAFDEVKAIRRAQRRASK